MELLIAGVALWCVVHLTPALARPLKRTLVAALGQNGYKGVFALLIAASVVLMVVGWRATVPEQIFEPAPWAGAIMTALMAVAFILVGASHYPSKLRRVVRHPMLTGVVVWAGAHLLANGDSRSLILFGGLGLWALIEQPLINYRDGAWVKPEAPAVKVEIRGIVISLIVLAAAIFLHPYYTGVSPFPD